MHSCVRICYLDDSSFVSPAVVVNSWVLAVVFRFHSEPAITSYPLCCRIDILALVMGSKRHLLTVAVLVAVLCCEVRLAQFSESE